jgi:hypothetical protein
MDAKKNKDEKRIITRDFTCDHCEAVCVLVIERGKMRHMDCDCGYVYMMKKDGLSFERKPGGTGTVWMHGSWDERRTLTAEEAHEVITSRIIRKECA